LEQARLSQAWDPRDSISSVDQHRPFMAHNRNESTVSKSSSLRNEVSPEKGSHAYYNDMKASTSSYYPEEMESEIYGSYAGHNPHQQYQSPVRSQADQGLAYQPSQSPTKSGYSQGYDSPSYVSPTKSGYRDSPSKQSPTYGYGQQQQQQSSTYGQVSQQYHSPTYGGQSSHSPSYPPNQQNHSPSYPSAGYSDPYTQMQGQPATQEQWPGERERSQGY